MSAGTCYVCSRNKVHIIAQANQMIAGDAVQQETPVQLLGGLAKPKRKFNITALAKRMQDAPSELEPSSAMPLAQCSATPSQEQEVLLPIADVGFSRRWVMIKHKGAPHVHLLPNESNVPLYWRRQGCACRPITRLQPVGSGIQDLSRMG